MDALIKMLMDHLGVVPLIIIVLIGLWFVLRELRRNQGALEKSLTDYQEKLTLIMDAMKKEFQADLDRLQKHGDASDEKHAKELEKLEQRLLDLETSCMSKEDVYRMVGGWRHDIDRLSQSIDRIADKLYERTK